jgi:hypothetical protein
MCILFLYSTSTMMCLGIWRLGRQLLYVKMNFYINCCADNRTWMFNTGRNCNLYIILNTTFLYTFVVSKGHSQIINISCFKKTRSSNEIEWTESQNISSYLWVANLADERKILMVLVWLLWSLNENIMKHACVRFRK